MRRNEHLAEVRTTQSVSKAQEDEKDPLIKVLFHYHMEMVENHQ